MGIVAAVASPTVIDDYEADVASVGRSLAEILANRARSRALRAHAAQRRAEVRAARAGLAGHAA